MQMAYMTPYLLIAREDRQCEHLQRKPKLLVPTSLCANSLCELAAQVQEGWISSLYPGSG
jgi:hypothetical protein